MKRIAFFCILAASVLSACQLLKLRDDLRTMDTIHWVRCEVSGTDQKQPIYVMVYGANGDLLKFKTLPSTGPVDFYLSGGRYDLVAFQDLNGDQIYNVGEPANDKPFETPATATVDGFIVELQLQATALPKQFAIDLHDPTNIATLEAHFHNRGTVKKLSDAQFDPANGSIGYWQPWTFIEKFETGIFFLEKYDPKKIPVLFIHGATGTPRDFEGLMNQLDRQRMQPWFFYYPSGLPLAPIGQYLAFAMNDLHERYHFKSMIVVAHSMGGLVARSFINEDLRQGTPVPVDAFISISTPWGGVPVAQKGVEHSPAVVPSWNDIVDGSAFMTALLKTPLHNKPPHYLFFSYAKPPGMNSPFLDGNNDGAITLKSQLKDEVASQAQQVYGFNEDHRSVLKSRLVAERINKICAP